MPALHFPLQERALQEGVHRTRFEEFHPRGTRFHGDEALAKKNEPFAEKYGIEGFPTIVLFTPEGKEFNRFFATGIAKPEEMLAVLDMALERKDLD